MKVLVTGSAGHLGEGLMRTLAKTDHTPIGLDRRSSRWTHHVAPLEDADAVHACVRNVDAVIHAATLHKPHIVTHSKRDFIDSNVIGTLNLLEASVAHGVSRFLFTSSTTVFSRRCARSTDEPATWITEDLTPLPKNIYGTTKLAAEGLCELFHHRHGLPCLVLRTSRFFPEDDDQAAVRAAFSPDNAKLNELLYRRVDLDDACTAHVLALERAPTIGFDTYIISATTPFVEADCSRLASELGDVLDAVVPFREDFDRLGWSLPTGIDRVYVNTKARRALGWNPVVDFRTALARIRRGEPAYGPLTEAVGAKAYHAESFDSGPYPVDDDGDS